MQKSSTMLLIYPVVIWYSIYPPNGLHKTKPWDNRDKLLF